MKKSGWLSIVSVVLVAAISGFLLLRLFIQRENVGEIGLLGVMIASMLSHLTVVARDMFLPLFLPLASVYNPIILGIFAGVGGAFGEVTTYFLGWGVSESVGRISSVEDKISKWINKYGLWAVLLVALTPLPDTPIVILAGSRKLPFRKLLVVEIFGKSILYSVGAVLGRYVYSGLEGFLGTVVTSILIVIGSLIFCIVVTWKPSRDLIFGWMEKIIF
jgi:membrane protein YqaA with SNARE-associated domain